MIGLSLFYALFGIPSAVVLSLQLSNMKANPKITTTRISELEIGKFYEEKQFVEGKLVDLVKGSKKENLCPTIEKPTEFSVSWGQGALEELPKIGLSSFSLLRKK